MSKILYHGDSPTVATGFGNVSRNLLSGLAKDHDITVIGINDRGGYKDAKEFPYKVYPAVYNDFNDIFGFKRLLNAIGGQDPEIKEKNFDTLFIQYDFFLLAETYIGENNLFAGLKQMTKPGVRKIIYTPIDNPLIAPRWKEILEWFDVIIVPSFYAYKILEGLWGTKIAKEKVKVIYYGVEDIFKPLPTAEITKIRNRMSDAMMSLYKIKVDMNEKFIVGFVGRNQWRKDIYRTVKIFSEFKKEHKNAYLYLHTEPNNPEGGNVLDLCSIQGLEYGKDYLVPLQLNTNTGIARADMNEIYNIMDVYLTSSVGEGFGLPVLEAMKCKVPVIAPNNTTMPELLKDGRGLIYNTNNTVSFGAIDFMRERELGDIEAGYRALRTVYKNEDKSKMLDDAKKFADKYTPELMSKEVSYLI